MQLTPTSYLVLGFLREHGPGTPYDLKQGVAAGTGNFWSVPHSQLYAEPDRLVGAGLLSVEREAGGRRRKVYSLTEAGREALAAWLREPPTAVPELRDQGLLKLFFGADPAVVARGQLEAHRARLARYEQLHALVRDAYPGPALTLEAGIEHERVWVRWWSRLAGAPEGGAELGVPRPEPDPEQPDARERGDGGDRLG